MDWSSEVAAADWIIERLHPFAQDVGSFVPDGFAAYARVLHPASRTERASRVKTRWADVARASGAPLGATTRFEEIATMDVDPPLVGTLELPELNALTEALAAATGTPESCWFGIWDGYGWMKGAPAGARVQVPERSLALYHGPIAAASVLSEPPPAQSPNLWWPEDHAWCAASEIDHHSTYVGGPQAVVDRLLDDGRLEVLPVHPTDPVTD